MPEINISMTAIVVAVVAHFIFGFIWYTPLFGKAWGKEMGYDPNQKPASSEMVKGMVFMIIGNFFMAWVLAHNMAAWDPTSWGLSPSEMSPASNAFMAALFT